MTLQEIIDKFTNYIDGETIDATLALQLANDAMHEIEVELNPIGLQVVDTSQSTSIGQTYLTPIPLPVDSFYPAETLYVGDQPYFQVPFDKYIEYKDKTGFFFVDVADSVYYLTGTQQKVQQITFPYTYATPDLALGDSPVWPPQFHSLIPLKMAIIFYPIDAGERGRAWDDRWIALYEQGLNRFKDYDQRLKLNALGRATPYGNTTTGQREDRINLT